MKLNKSIFFQFSLLIIFITILGIFINNLTFNLSRIGLGIDFSWLFKPASFALAEHSLPYNPSDSYAWALLIGWLNSIKIIFIIFFWMIFFYFA